MYKDFFAQKKLITFDLDGTTVKSEQVWDAAFTEVAKVAGIDPTTTGICGNTVAERWKHILSATDLKTPRPVPELVELTQTEFVKHIAELEVTAGFWPFVAELKLLKQLNLALVTNTARVVTDRVLAQLELKEVFDFVICGNEVKSPKPSPQIYQATLAQFKLPAKSALAFEDSLPGCIAAAKAGLKLICVWDEVTPKRNFPDEVLEFTSDFTPFPGEMDTTYLEDIKQMAKEQEQALKPTT
jgi:HAD superfamily hydrolase (TIGR01509 family)